MGWLTGWHINRKWARLQRCFGTSFELPWCPSAGRCTESCPVAAAHRVGGAEAKLFFPRTGLPQSALSKAWVTAKATLPPQDKGGLTAEQFAAALRVVTYAQVRLQSTGSEQHCRGDVAAATGRHNGQTEGPS